MIHLEWTSADIAAAMDALSGIGVMLYDAVVVDPLTMTFCVSRNDLNKAKALCEKRGDRLRILRREGFVYTIFRFRKRPVLISGFLLLLVLTLFLPTRVLFVQVEGNALVPANRILEAAADYGICFGASRRAVRSESIKNGLLGAVPELKWVGVNTKGCVAVISVREKAELEAPVQQTGISSIVASTDGVILSATATEGNLLCAPGQAVTAGQVLISAYTDCGIHIRAVRAEGEVVAQTRRDLTVITPATAVKRGPQQRQWENYSLILGKNRVFLWKDSGICGDGCGRMYEEYYVTLPGGFQLPVALAKETIQCYSGNQTETAEDEVYRMLHASAETLIQEQMLAGSVQDSQTVLSKEKGRFVFRGHYLCTEMIGRVRIEQIGDTNGKDD